MLQQSTGVWSLGADKSSSVFIALTEDLPLWKYSAQFCNLDQHSCLDDTTLKSIYLIGANYYRPLDLPEMGDLTW